MKFGVALEQVIDAVWGYFVGTVVKKAHDENSQVVCPPRTQTHTHNATAAAIHRLRFPGTIWVTPRLTASG